MFGVESEIHDEYQDKIKKLLDLVGDIGECKGCGREVWWVVHKNGKKAPYTRTALNHFIDCPNADQFRKKKKTS